MKQFIKSIIDFVGDILYNEGYAHTFSERRTSGK